jgi:hypothetical protein
MPADLGLESRQGNEPPPTNDEITTGFRCFGSAANITIQIPTDYLGSARVAHGARITVTVRSSLGVTVKSVVIRVQPSP